MGVAERDGQEFELVHFSEATAMAYFSENRDAAAITVKPLDFRRATVVTL